MRVRPVDAPGSSAAPPGLLLRTYASPATMQFKISVPRDLVHRVQCQVSFEVGSWPLHSFAGGARRRLWEGFLFIGTTDQPVQQRLTRGCRHFWRNPTSAAAGWKVPDRRRRSPGTMVGELDISQVWLFRRRDRRRKRYCHPAFLGKISGGVTSARARWFAPLRDP